MTLKTSEPQGADDVAVLHEAPGQVDTNGELSRDEIIRIAQESGIAVLNVHALVRFAARLRTPAALAPDAMRFERRRFGAYTDTQIKWIRIGWNAAMRARQGAA